MKEGRKFNKIVSLVLAAVMMVSVFAVTTPQEVEAASTFSQNFKSSGTTNLKIKKTQSYGYTKKDTLIKFKSKNDGYITLKLSSGNSQSDGYITFCDSKKKNIGVNKEYFDTANSTQSFAYTRTYAVKKGKTYYFKVRSSDYLKIKATVKNLKKDAGTKRSNAKNITRNKDKKGIVFAGEKKTDWYKFNLTASKQVKLSINVSTNGVTYRRPYYNSNGTGFKVTLYDKNGDRFVENSSSSYDFAANALYSTKSVPYFLEDRFGRTYPLENGTYYVKVEPLNKKTSGYYKLKWSYN